MQTEQPTYYAILTAHVRYSTKISSLAKLLYAEITALSSRDGYCYASNLYFATNYSCSIDTVSRCIKELENAGFVRVDIRPDLGNRRHIWAIDTKTELSEKAQQPIRKNADTYPQKCGKGIRKNADNNNKENNKDNREETPSLQAHQISPVPTSETPSDLKEKSAAGRGQAATYYEKTQYVINGTEGDAKDVTATAQDASVMPNSQREAYRTDSELRTIMAAYYKANPNEYAVGILNDAKGSRLTKEQITNCMVMWSSHMIENSKYNYSAHQLHQAFKRWVLRETQYVKQNPATKAGPDAAPESVTLKTKNFNFQ